ncbi:regulator of microtubule dynamics protein 1-like isoform X2 [Varroa jacobsoni]|uniref:regulator of microtubule dynamics protein 1-like isoform X2 n=1 Tax=Varroa jacobsoni TaxID=62625 RepID=UPI000BF6A9E6|nr:regulator of microtubule dynamics protein 1-like isoform X2 [Varroa jacobsoni]
MWIIAPGFFRVGAVRPRILLGVSRVIGSVARSYVQSGNASIFSLTVNIWRNRFNRHNRQFRTFFISSVPATAWSFTIGAKMTTIDAVKKCDELYEAGNIIEAHQAIMVAKDDPDPEVQWRVARMQWKVAEKSGKAEEMERAIKEGVIMLRANLEKNPKCPNTHKWIAILLGSKEQHATFKEQIEEAFLIRDHLQKAIEYNPDDGYAHYILGKWCYQVASVSWYKKKAAAALFASPPESTYEIALEHFKDAERLTLAFCAVFSGYGTSVKADIFSTCFLMAAQCLVQMGKNKEASDYLRKCVQMENRDDESKKNAEEARRIAKKNGIKL